MRVRIEIPLVKPMIRDAAVKYCVALIVNQSNRKPAQAQQFHICHMFLHNYFHTLRPKFHSGKTIDWKHLSDPTIKWALIDESKKKFLLTAAGTPARLKPGLMQWVEPPHEHKSKHAMANFLKHHGVKGMAAPGMNGCGEPCCCGCKASRHITGEAVDLQGLEQLGIHIMAAEPGKYHDPIEAVDIFLHKHHLYRPMGHLKGTRRELWHVEAIPHHLSHLPHHQLRHLPHHHSPEQH